MAPFPTMLRMALLAIALLCMPAAGASPQVVPATPAQAIPQAGTTDAQGIRTEATVVVTGRQPGPGLWRASKDGRELFILGTITPLPANMELATGEIEEVIARSQEVIRAPYISVGTDVGKLRMLMLLPSLIGVRNNPGGKKLKDVLPPEMYTRWQPFKAQFLPGNDGVEKMRPIFAAQELYGAAIKRSAMTTKDPTAPVVTAAIEKHHPSVSVVKLELKVKDPKAAIRQLKSSQIEDLECMRGTLDRLGVDLGTMRARANAWATGDVAALQELPLANQYDACIAAISESAIGRRIGMGDGEARIKAMWLEKAQAALATNTTTFAILPLGDMLEPGGYLDALRARGYEVEAPY